MIQKYIGLLTHRRTLKVYVMIEEFGKMVSRLADAI